MTDYAGDMQPLPVHVLSMPAAPPPPPRRRIRTTFRTVVVTAANATVSGPMGAPAVSSTELLPASENRKCAWVQALDDDIVLADNESDARKGHGTRILAANSAPWPIGSTDPVYVAVPLMSGPTSRVSISVDYYVSK